MTEFQKHLLELTQGCVAAVSVNHVIARSERDVPPSPIVWDLPHPYSDTVAAVLAMADEAGHDILRICTDALGLLEDCKEHAQPEVDEDEVDGDAVVCPGPPPRALEDLKRRMQHEVDVRYGSVCGVCWQPVQQDDDDRWVHSA